MIVKNSQSYLHPVRKLLLVNLPKYGTLIHAFTIRKNQSLNQLLYFNSDTKYHLLS